MAASPPGIKIDRIYAALLMTPKPGIEGEDISVILSNEEMSMPMSRITQTYLPANASVAQWDITIIKF